MGESPVSLSCCSLPEEIPLTQGMVALVDQADYEFLMQWNWHARKGDAFDKYYATRAVHIPAGDKKRKQTSIQMHNVIMPPPEGMEIDHINSNSLDNRRCNLRACTHLQNRWNSRPQHGSSSKYKGVSFQKATNYYKAYIIVRGIYKHLGCYPDENDAARAYNRAARVEHGEYAKLNPVEDGPIDRLKHPVQYRFHKAKEINYVS